MNVFPEAWHAFTATRRSVASARRIASCIDRTSCRRSARQNRTGSRTTAANSSAPGALARTVRLRHHCLDHRQWDQRLAILAGVLHRLKRLAEPAVREPGRRVDPIAKLRVVLATEDC